MSAHRAREVSQSFLALMFSEMVHYQTSKICNAVELELALEGIGRTIGKKVLELLCYRDCLIKRDHGVISMLQVRLKSFSVQMHYACSSSLLLAGKSSLAKQQIL